MITFKYQIVVILISIVVLLGMENTNGAMVMFVVLACVCVYSIRPKSHVFKLRILTSDNHDSIILHARLNNKQTLFLLDTGYAGPPVLSTTFLATEQHDYKQALKQMTEITDDDRNRALRHFLNHSGCFVYTSGCTMKLMGIGTTTEQQADMVLCQMLQFETMSGHYVAPKRASTAHADIFVTHNLPSSVHILTSDFLMHSAPVFLSISKKCMEMNIHPARFLMLSQRFVQQPLQLSGGSLVVSVEVAGQTMNCTVDTGASGPICLGKDAADRINTCTFPKERRRLGQSGVNGEHICSELVSASVKFCGKTFEDAAILVNDMSVQQVDGYIGLGFLRAFDMLISSKGIAFAYTKIPLKSIDDYIDATIVGKCNIALQCKRK